MRRIFGLGNDLIHKLHLAVSPDGVAVVKIDGIIDCMVASVEIKTRVALDRQDGHIVQCDLDDDAFRDCVPAEHCTQFLHQAAVLNCMVALYVVAISSNASARGRSSDSCDLHSKSYEASS